MQPPASPLKKPPAAVLFGHYEDTDSKRRGSPQPSHAGRMHLLLEDPKCSPDDVQNILTYYYDPHNFKEQEIRVGVETKQITIQSESAFKLFLAHIEKNNATFRNLRFCNCKISPNCLKLLCTHLSNLQNLKSLHFEKCEITNNDLAEIFCALTALTKSLQELSIVDHRFNSDINFEQLFMLFLMKVTKLTHLNLSGNGFTDAHINALAKVLALIPEKNQSVKTLTLDRNQIGYEGAFALCLWLKNYSPCTKCSLINNNIKIESILALERIVQRVPSPLVFENLPPVHHLPGRKAPVTKDIAPQTTAPKADDRSLIDLKEMLQSAEQCETWQWEMIKDKKAEKNSDVLKVWLKLGFKITDVSVPKDQKSWYSFFQAICLAIRQSSKTTELVNNTITHIVTNLNAFGNDILSHFSTQEHITDLGVHFQYDLQTRDIFPANVFYHAVPTILEQWRILRPIHIYSEAREPVRLPNGNLAIPPTISLENEANRTSEPICLFFDGKNFFPLERKGARP